MGKIGFQLTPEVMERVEVEVKYSGYIERQRAQIKKFKRLEAQRIDEEFDYSSRKGFSTEAREKLEKIQPRSVGQAMRISGVTPADISVLLVHLRRDGGDAQGAGRRGKVEARADKGLSTAGRPAQ
jgi:tRNA uridine 5-carboxymethylaminomethyl modification enzyme